MEPYFFVGAGICIVFKLIDLIIKQNKQLKKTTEEYINKLEYIAEKADKISNEYLDSIEELYTQQPQQEVLIPVVGIVTGVASESLAPAPVKEPTPYCVHKFEKYPRLCVDVLKEKLLEGTGCWIEINNPSFNKGVPVIDVYLIAKTKEELEFGLFIINRHLNSVIKLNGQGEGVESTNRRSDKE